MLHQRNNTFTQNKDVLTTFWHKPVSPSPYSAMESVSLSGAAFGSLPTELRPCDLLSNLENKIISQNEMKHPFEFH